MQLCEVTVDQCCKQTLVEKLWRLASFDGKVNENRPQESIIWSPGLADNDSSAQSPSLVTLGPERTVLDKTDGCFGKVIPTEGDKCAVKAIALDKET